MEDDKKNTQETELEHLNDGFDDNMPENISQSEGVKITKSSFDEGETTPSIIKKLHRRQISSASAKMFALHYDIFPNENQSSAKFAEDLPKFNFVSDINPMSKEVRFESTKADDGASRSMVRSDIEGTSETQFTVVTNNQSTGAETVGTSRSSIANEQPVHSDDTPLEGY